MFQTWKENREYRKAKKLVEEMADGFWETYYLLTTFHGRNKVRRILQAVDEGVIDMDPRVVGMYEFFLETVNYHAYATLN